MEEKQDGYEPHRPHEELSRETLMQHFIKAENTLATLSYPITVLWGIRSLTLRIMEYELVSPRVLWDLGS